VDKTAASIAWTNLMARVGVESPSKSIVVTITLLEVRYKDCLRKMSWIAPQMAAEKTLGPVYHRGCCLYRATLRQKKINYPINLYIRWRRSRYSQLTPLY
jgi:hypothetical protein